MRPVMQTIGGEPDGNCLAAWVASILELGIEDVPVSGKAGEWPEELTAFCKARGLSWIWIDYRKMPKRAAEDSPFYWPDGVYWIASGPSGYGITHSVVCLDGEMVHNPCPGYEGVNIESVDDGVILFRHPVDPAPTICRWCGDPIDVASPGTCSSSEGLATCESAKKKAVDG